MLRLTADARSQYLVLAVLSAVAVALVGIQQFLGWNYLWQYTGGLNPLAAAAGLAVLGVVLFPALRARSGFVIYKGDFRRGLRNAVALAVLFGAIIIPADVLIVYPADINVPLPAALLFYPVIGFFAEIVFHLLPLTLLLFALNAVFTTANRERMIVVAIITVALVEPVYQTSLMMSLGRYSLAVLLFNALHVFAINLSELVLFRRFDFVTMYAMRLAYYLIWHIAWGYTRLSILF